jgi:hypothetical protein
MAIGFGVVIVGVAGALLVRVVGGLLSRPWPRVHGFVARHGLWAAFPVMLVYLLIVAWPIGVVAILLAPAIVYVLRRIELPYGIARER